MVPPSSQMRHPEADPAIAAGRIIDWQSAQYYSALAEREKVPLLQARLDHVIRPRTEHPCAFGIGAVPLGDGSSAVTLRLQVGTSQFYWLAHPDDPELWQLLETWAAAGRCAFMLSGKRSWTLALDYGAIDKELKLLRRRSGTFDAGQFADAVFDLVALKLLQLSATSDIEGVAGLEHVQVCVLATSAVLSARPLTVLMPGSSARH